MIGRLFSENGQGLSTEAQKNSRNFLWNTFGIAANSLNSLFFLIIVTRLSGISDAGVFSLCFAYSIVFNAVAMYGMRAYQVTDVENRFTSGEYVTSRIVTCVFAIVVTLIFVTVNRYDPYKFAAAMLLATAKIIEAFSDVYFGIFQKNDRLDFAGKANFMKSAGGLVAFFIILLIIKSLLAACLSLVIIDLAVLFFYEQRHVFKFEKLSIKLNIKRIGTLLAACFSVFGVSVLSLFVMNEPRNAIDKVMSTASQGIYGIVSMPGTTISIFTAFLIQFFLSFFANKYAKKDRRGFIKIIIELLSVITIATILFEIFCYFFGIPLLKLLYGLDLSAYLPQLLLIIIGVFFLSIAAVFCSALTTMRYTKIQLFIYLADTLLAFCISPSLVRGYGILGAVAAYDIITGFQVVADGIALIVAVKRSMNTKKGCVEHADCINNNPDL